MYIDFGAMDFRSVLPVALLTEKDFLLCVLDVLTLYVNRIAGINNSVYFDVRQKEEKAFSITWKS